ncbi:MAG: hypothetical protein ACYTG7_02480 [Planctomycetota bacterium]|jgi:hypothetical protein
MALHRASMLMGSIGLLAGLLAGYAMWKHQEYPLPGISERSKETVFSRAAEPERPETVDEQGAEAKEVEPSSGMITDEQTLFSETLLAYFRDKFVKAWKDHRAKKPTEEDVEQGEKFFREAILKLPELAAQVMAEERNDEDSMAYALEQGDGTVLIESAKKGVFKPGESDRTREAVDRSVAQRVKGREIDGMEFSSNKEARIEEGMTLVFGYGIYTLDERRLRGEDREHFPVDVTVKGAGMDSTLLHLGDISIRGDAKRLAFRDLTLDCENTGLFDMRTGSLVLDLERVRLVRFDAGHGGCCIFSARGCLVRMTDSEIVGGYGGSPGNGRLFRSNPVIMRFTSCRFELVELGLNRVESSSRISFQNCRFSLLDSNPLLEEHPSVDFTGCTFESIRDSSMTRDKLRKDLSKIFPQLDGS